MEEIEIGGEQLKLRDEGMKKKMNVRMRVRERDVQIERKINEEIRIRKIMKVKVKGIERGEGKNENVFIDLRGRSIGERMKRRQVDDMGMQVGDKVVDIVKEVQVDREEIREK